MSRFPNYKVKRQMVIRPTFPITIRGIKVTKGEYYAFVAYLNERHVQEFTKDDIERFIEFYYSGDYLTSLSQVPLVSDAEKEKLKKLGMTERMIWRYGKAGAALLG